MVTNYLSPVSFQIVIERMPNVEFFTQRAMIPALTMNPVEISSPIQNFYETPDRVTYSEFDLGFIVDEDMKNYLEIHDWMVGLGTPQDQKQYADLSKTKEGIKSDITLVINNSSKRPNKKIVFTDCFPMALSSINMSVTQTDVIYPEVTATFRYNYFTVSNV